MSFLLSLSFLARGVYQMQIDARRALSFDQVATSRVSIVRRLPELEPANKSSRLVHHVARMTVSRSGPVAIQGGARSTTFRRNFYGWWNAFRDEVIKRDMDWIRKVHPNGYTLDKWMAENQYDSMLCKDLPKTRYDWEASSQEKGRVEERWEEGDGAL